MFSADLIPKRDEVRQMFVDSIDLFCKEVDLLPLQQREKCLQVMRPLDCNLFYVVELDYFLEGNIEVFYIHFFFFQDALVQLQDRGGINSLPQSVKNFYYYSIPRILSS